MYVSLYECLLNIKHKYTFILVYLLISSCPKILMIETFSATTKRFDNASLRENSFMKYLYSIFQTQLWFLECKYVLVRSVVS